MRKYPEKLRRKLEQSISDKDIRKIIEEILSDELPDCITNERFLESVYSANMIDKIVERIVRMHDYY